MQENELYDFHVVDFVKTFNKFPTLNKCLHVMCENGHQNVIDYLAEIGADDFYNAMTFACKGGHEKVIEYLIGIGVTNYHNAIILALENGHINVVKFLLMRCDLKNHYTFIQAACKGGNMECVKLFLFEESIYSGSCLCYGLFGAGKGGHMDIIEFVIELAKKRNKYTKEFLFYGIKGACL